MRRQRAASSGSEASRSTCRRSAIGGKFRATPMNSVQRLQRSTMKVGLPFTLLAACLVLRSASAQEPKTSVREYVALAGTVDRIDRTSRLLTLQGDDGRTHGVYVPRELTLFDELKPGDNNAAAFANPSWCRRVPV